MGIYKRGRDLYWGLNPFHKVKFFREFKIGFRVLSPEEEEKLLQNAAPYLQDLICFALNTGMRIGEIFLVCWQNGCDKSVTVCTTMQQSRPRLSQNAV